jgi:hypothetical protein
MALTAFSRGDQVSLVANRRIRDKAWQNYEFIRPAPAPGGSMFCDQCGQGTTEAAKFCASCGAEIALPIDQIGRETDAFSTALISSEQQRSAPKAAHKQLSPSRSTAVWLALAGVGICVAPFEAFAQLLTGPNFGLSFSGFQQGNQGWGLLFGGAVLMLSASLLFSAPFAARWLASGAVAWSGAFLAYAYLNVRDRFQIYKQGGFTVKIGPGIALAAVCVGLACIELLSLWRTRADPF